MGITYGDHLIDSGYYDITPEQEREMQEREIEERKGTEMNEIEEYYEGLLAEVVRERENYNAMHQAACLEIDRLQEAKRRALDIADERVKETNEMRALVKRGLDAINAAIQQTQAEQAGHDRTADKYCRTVEQWRKDARAALTDEQGEK